MAAAPILVICQRIPYPPRKGDKLRSWNFISRLARERPVHLAAFIDDVADLPWRSKLQDICASTFLPRLHPTWAKVKSLPALGGTKPLTLTYFHHAHMKKWVNDIRVQHNIDTAYIFSSAVAPLVMTPEWAGVRRVVDMVDVDSDKWRQYAETTGGVSKWIYRREAKQLEAFEVAIARQAAATILISDSEARHLQRRAPDAAAKIHTIPNGIDTDFFDPSPDYPNPYADQTPAVVFTGAMDYWPNVDAVTWFADHVLPVLRSRFSPLWFHIVGANPTTAVRQLAKREHINVTGRVEAIQPYLAHADVVVAPVRIARGVQNKVLEGMAMARPVVTTSMGLEGLSAVPDTHLYIADDAESYAAQIGHVLSNGNAAMGKAAREFVKKTYDWDSAFDMLRDLLAPQWVSTLQAGQQR